MTKITIILRLMHYLINNLIILSNFLFIKSLIQQRNMIYINLITYQNTIIIINRLYLILNAYINY